MKDFPEAEHSCAPVHPMTSGWWEKGWSTCQMARHGHRTLVELCTLDLFQHKVLVLLFFFFYLEAHIIEHCLSDEFQTLSF